MIKIPATDGKTYYAPSWPTFKAWVVRTAVAYVILAFAVSFGIYFYTDKSKKDLVHNINIYAYQACLTSAKPGSTAHKYNDLVQSIIDSRIDALNNDISQHNQGAIKVDQAAIKRYRRDFLNIPTPDQCAAPILKG